MEIMSEVGTGHIIYRDQYIRSSVTGGFTKDFMIVAEMRLCGISLLMGISTGFVVGIFRVMCRSKSRGEGWC